MKKFLFLFYILLCASVAARAAEISASGANLFNLDVYKSRPVYIEFSSSPKMTEKLNQNFSDLGFKLVSNSDDADLKIKIVVGFFFQKSHGNKVQIDFGKVVEQAEDDILTKKAEESVKYSTGAERAPLYQWLRGNMSANMVLGAGIVETIFNLTGIRAKFNKMIAGDERGFCLGTAEMCKNWNQYVQQMRMAAIIEPKGGKQIIVRAQAATRDDDLLPEPLFHEAMAELTARLLPEQTSSDGSPSQAAPASTLPASDTMNEQGVASSAQTAPSSAPAANVPSSASQEPASTVTPPSRPGAVAAPPHVQPAMDTKKEQGGVVSSQAAPSSAPAAVVTSSASQEPGAAVVPASQPAVAASRPVIIKRQQVSPQAGDR